VKRTPARPRRERQEDLKRIIWTLIKVLLGLAIAIPLGLLALRLTFGVIALTVGLAVLVAKLACIGLIGYGVYRVARLFYRSPAPPRPVVRDLPAPDRYYEAAMRELDSELRT
jgi:hypothetical protein